jgi:BirA family biotin operon repressor/biotin-[acetyl-CoA-carboxylase] ligase
MGDTGAGRYRDLDRPGLDAVSLVTALQRGDGLWRAVEVVDEIGSTNAALAARAADGEAEGLVLVAEHQVAGRGAWTAPGRRRRGPG